MKILLTQLRRIGDVITTTPAVRAVRHAWPEATIDYMTEAPSDEIFRANSYIDNIITVKRRMNLKEYASLIKRLRHTRYDVMIDFFCNPTSAYITRLSGCPVRIGFGLRFRKYFYTHTVNRTLFPKYLYAGIHKLALTAQIGAMPAASEKYSEYEPEFPITLENQQEADLFLNSLGVTPEDKLITLGIVTRHEFRQWPLENFAAVADALIEKFGAKILFIYGPGEEAFPRKVRELMRYTPLSEYDHSGISRMRGIFERTRVHIGCDNGPANIAKASGMKTIILYSNARASSWTPPGNSNYITFEVEIPCKDHCLRENCPDPRCIRDIRPEKVFQAAAKILETKPSKSLN